MWKGEVMSFIGMIASCAVLSPARLRRTGLSSKVVGTA
jgi:hypothetical protein